MINIRRDSRTGASPLQAPAPGCASLGVERYGSGPNAQARVQACEPGAHGVSGKCLGAEILTKGLSNLESSARWAALVGAIVGITLEAIKVSTKGKFWLSGVGLGLAFVILFNTCLAMFMGSFFFWLRAKKCTDVNSQSHKIFVKNLEPICAGLIAGGALTGILVVILENFVL